MPLIKKHIELKDFVITKIKKLPLKLEIGLAAAILVIILLFGYYGWNLNPAKFGNRELQVIQVPYGSTLREVGILLAKNHLIRSKLVFEIYVRLNPKQRMAKAGYYRIGSGMPVPVIVRELRRGIPQSVRVTIPEGLTNSEIADLLARKGLINREKFINTTRDHYMLDDILLDYHVNSGTEGYLFPDTYNFVLNATSEKTIITEMVSRFKEVFQNNFAQIPFSRRKEIVIIASLVEKEAKKAEERPIIAGVFYNRLRKGYPLQSCATIQYSLGKRKEHLYFKDLQVNSPYNTYLHPGLPPGPIANPGLASLKAAVFPAQVKYLYFVAKPDGTHIFSTTYEQHINAQHKIAKLGSIQGT